MIDWRKLFMLDNRAVSDGPPDESYRVYTRDHDLELHGMEIVPRLASSSPDKPAWRDLSGVDWREAVRLSKHLADVQSAASHFLRPHLLGDAEDLAVTLLIDQSGSMKGQSIAAAAAATRAFEAALSSAGVRTEILGFSTAGWHGGFARKAWLRQGRPPRPGRLCALLHIVYKSHDEPLWSEPSQEAMLHPDLLRENVDGEALLWAANRLTATSAKYKIMIVLSDGAPVDDSTLMENGPSYLERDICRTIRQLEDNHDMVLGALGIGYAVDRYYRHTRETNTDTVLQNLNALFEALVTSAQVLRP